MSYFCCDKLRRNAVSASALNGIDFLEVIDGDALLPAERQRFLHVHLLKDITALGLSAANVRIEGGERVQNIVVLAANQDGGNPEVLIVEVDRPGDFSTYTLRLVQGLNDSSPPANVDEQLAAIDFSFKVECPSEFDCEPRRDCPEELPQEPDINYLSKDYSSFRRLMLDRLSVVTPDWRKRNPADLGVTLVEALAYTADQLSYQQDAIATEAYLGTARRRISIRRHARLMDYYLSDGCNARTWVQLLVDNDLPTPAGQEALLAEGVRLFTAIPDQDTYIAADPDVYRRAQAAFETMEPVAALYQAHNELSFYSWSNQRCCLAKGATAATLFGHYPNLQRGDILIFSEVLGPETGVVADADPNKRHAVLLTRADLDTDTVPNPAVDITRIEWHEEDALQFAFCLSADTQAGYRDDISVALGNIVLADHGLSISNEDLGAVPKATLLALPEKADSACAKPRRGAIGPRFRPKPAMLPLTHQGPAYQRSQPARAAMNWPMREVRPRIKLHSQLGAEQATWYPQADLLNSDENKEEFVVEIESNGRSYIRFGDDRHGKRPQQDTRFSADYRVGNGRAGNIGADTLRHITTGVAGISELRNPLAAQGGIAPETIEEARQRVPIAYRTQERAVTEADYAEVSERKNGIQKARADFRWTGSWYTVFMTADREQGRAITDTFADDLRRHIEPHRMAGHDLEVESPQFVPLEIELQLCVKDEYFRSAVKRELLERLSNRQLADGRLGFFHPDSFSFGQDVYLSPLYAAAQKVVGVASMTVNRFQRLGTEEPESLANGVLTIGAYEIARLDNDPNFPEQGILHIRLGGGK